MRNCGKRFEFNRRSRLGAVMQKDKPHLGI